MMIRRTNSPNFLGIAAKIEEVHIESNLYKPINTSSVEFSSEYHQITRPSIQFPTTTTSSNRFNTLSPQHQLNQNAVPQALRFGPSPSRWRHGRSRTRGSTCPGTMARGSSPRARDIPRTSPGSSFSSDCCQISG